MALAFYTTKFVDNSTLDLSDFSQPELDNVDFMFCGCNVTNIVIPDGFAPKSKGIHSDDPDFGPIFDGCLAKSITLKGSIFSTSSDVDVTFNYLFYSCTELTTLDLSNVSNNNIIDTSSMFNGCTSLTSISFGSFDMSKCEDAKKMFVNCTKLETIYADND